MKKEKVKEIYLAGGCFWGVQKYLDRIPGIFKTEVGYANGTIENPTYEKVCYGNTHFAEVVYLAYIPEQVSLPQILEYYYKLINPISLNHQGNDVGEQYRTGIYYTENSQIEEIQKSVTKLQEKYNQPVKIEVKPIQNYYKAEEYHQKYLKKNPFGYCHISLEE